MLQEDAVDTFLQEVGRVYGATSNYVHLTVQKVKDRIDRVDSGATMGQETPGHASQVTDILFRGLSQALVFLFHAAPAWVAGDWFVEKDGSTVDWCFIRCRYIAMIDASFDYKHERQGSLAAIQERRRKAIR